MFPLSQFGPWDYQQRWPIHSWATSDRLSAVAAQRGRMTLEHQKLDRGRVSLIGCGPGDPELLTLRALKKLQEADVLVTDRLIGPGIAALARADARVIDVGKQPGGPSMPQDDINAILVREALLGHRVARLKGGDGFIFGRAAEEMAAVRSAGVDVEVIPGITAAHACAASIGLPLTLRGRVRQFSVATAATADGRLELDWEALAKPGQACAIYMGVGAATRIREHLLAAGAYPWTSVVIVENGTLQNERVIATLLDTLPEAMRDEGITGPAIIFIGLSWEAANLTRPQRVHDHAATVRLNPQISDDKPVPASSGRLARRPA
jgi:uroporphyrin-III C-methyltransferase/precorrin-2 dehydrogenase/sirohydrochlorin ferrochelatase